MGEELLNVFVEKHKLIKTNLLSAVLEEIVHLEVIDEYGKHTQTPDRLYLGQQAI